MMEFDDHVLVRNLKSEIPLVMWEELQASLNFVVDSLSSSYYGVLISKLFGELKEFRVHGSMICKKSQKNISEIYDFRHSLAIFDQFDIAWHTI